MCGSKPNLIISLQIEFVNDFQFLIVISQTGSRGLPTELSYTVEANTLQKSYSRLLTVCAPIGASPSPPHIPYTAAAALAHSSSASFCVPASAYTLTASSVPLGRTKHLGGRPAPPAPSRAIWENSTVPCPLLSKYIPTSYLDAAWWRCMTPVAVHLVVTSSDRR
mmetsp:Transcript_44593/g.87444  ORF Transcript_44593/g.87444 Transcript_44593/m.87444 type:complete len:165 (+) Transcript_44593:51-545(+)